MDCIFCKIAAHQVPSEILYEGDRVLSILDINPLHYGHSLIFPRNHTRDLTTLPEDCLHEILQVAQLVARGTVTAMNLEGFNLFSNNGAVAGQSVFHFHIHITPRYHNDNIRFAHGLKRYSGNEMAQYADLIRAGISSARSQ